MFETATDQLTELSPGESDDDLFQITCLALAEKTENRRHHLPTDLDTMEPGPFLAAILSAIQLDRLTGTDVVVVMKAHQRMLASHQAGLYDSMAETAHCVDGESTRRSEIVDEFAPEEIGAALTLTRRKANDELGIALDLKEALPLALQELAKGQIDGAKARLFAEDTQHLDATTRESVVSGLLGHASDMTTGQLRARLRRSCIEADPAEAESRMQHSLAERKVVAEANAEGTAALIVSQCSPDDVFAARDHVNRLARRLKTADETRNIDQLRADVAMDLLAGRLNGSSTQRGSVNLNVDLTTLAGLDNAPGDLGSFAPVVAEIARKVAAEQAQGAWTATVTDPETGEPLHAVAVRRRPTSAQVRKIRALHPSCVFAGCRIPAINCDLDHRIDHALGGPTTVTNHAPLCRRHHLAKHKRGWRYRKLNRVEVEWMSPLGRTYRTGRPP